MAEVKIESIKIKIGKKETREGVDMRNFKEYLELVCESFTDNWMKKQTDEFLKNYLKIRKGIRPATKLAIEKELRGRQYRGKDNKLQSEVIKKDTSKNDKISTPHDYSKEEAIKIIRSNLQIYMERKPYNLSDAKQIPLQISVLKKYKNAIETLEEYSFMDLFGTETVKKDYLGQDFKIKVPKEDFVFVLKNGNSKYLVNTEGYDYIRYIAKI